MLRLEDVPPAHPGPGDVRLKVQAMGLNRAESMFYHGRYLEAPKFPARLGYEAVGIVEAIGEGVDKSWIGKTVATIPGFSMNEYGVIGEWAVAPARVLGEYPPNLSPEQAAAIWMQYVTAYGALIYHGKTGPGDFVIVTAASSSVGLAAIQIVKAQGGKSIATTRTSAKKKELLSLGADYVIATEEEDLVSRVNEITDGAGARIVFDPIAGPGLEKLAQATKYGGIIFEYGALSTEPTPFPLFHALSRGLSIRGYTLWEVHQDPEALSAAKKYIYDYLADGTFVPKVDRTFSLAQIRAAYEHLESNSQIGKIVVTV